MTRLVPLGMRLEWRVTAWCPHASEASGLGQAACGQVSRDDDAPCLAA